MLAQFSFTSLNLQHLGCKHTGRAAFAFQGAANVQGSTKTVGKWVAAVLNEAQNDDGNASVRAQFWHNVSSQETHCKFSGSHLHSPAAVTVPQIFPIAQHMNIWCSKKKKKNYGMVCRAHWHHGPSA